MKLFALLITFLCPQGMFTQEKEQIDSINPVVTNSFGDNWYGQVGIDMSLLNPYGCNFVNVFPNGKSFGVNVGLGKQFTPVFGFRGYFKWENGIIKNDKAKWLSKADSKDGGYIMLAGDVMLNVHNLLGEYNSQRRWNFMLFPRMGALMCLKSGVGSPVIGLGISNTYRLNDKWSLYADASYHFITSALGYRTDTGSGNNGFLDINVGVKYDLGYNQFNRLSQRPYRSEHTVVINSFWQNWFVQAGIGMSLLNLYGSNFMNVFPNGKSVGINLGLGKWFSPEFGVRGGLNWQNGIVGNSHFSWMDPEGKPGGNHDGGGYGAVYMDVFFDVHNILAGYSKNRRWNAIVFPRVGLDSNLEAGTSSPLVGIGTEHTFRLNKTIRLFADLAYQFTSTEFAIKGDTPQSGSNSNGWFDLNVGIQYEFGRNTWDKPGEKRTVSHWEGGHNWPRFAVNTLASVGVGFALKTALKKMVKEERPDHSDKESFPSGHATMAFAAARSIDKEFRKESIWIPIAGYAAATAIGVERVASDRHHWYDVVAGAGLGIASAELTWWLSDLLFPQRKYGVAIGTSGNTIDVTVGL